MILIDTDFLNALAQLTLGMAALIAAFKGKKPPKN